MNKRSFTTLSLILAISLSISSQECHIFNLNAEVLDCTENNIFYVNLSFDSENVSDLGFSVLGNGNDYGDFSYGLESYNIGPLEGNCRTQYEFVVVDNLFDSCGTFVVLDEIICCENINCEMDVTEFLVSECDSTGFRTLEFYVDNPSPGLSGFDVYYVGALIGHYEYGNSPYTINVTGYNSAYSLLLQDTNHPNCSTVLSFESGACENAPECELYDDTGMNRIVNHEFICTSDSSYMAFLTLEYSGTSDSLWVQFYDNNISEPTTHLVAVTDFPYLLGEFDIDNTLYYYFVQEQDNVFCITGSEWNDAPDCTGHSECLLYNLVIEAHECDSLDNLVFLDFEFRTENPTSDRFIVRGNGMIYDTLEYGQPFYTVGPVEADCRTIYELVIIDLENSDCRIAGDLDGPICCDHSNDCAISDIVVDPQECLGDGFYSLYLDFNVRNENNDFFEVYSGNHNLGFYSLADLPIIIDSFPSRDSEYDIITICINDNAECCSTIEFLSPDCEDDSNCEFYNLIAEASECDSLGRFTVDIAFEVENPGDLGFIIRGNGRLYDTFEYGQAFYTIGLIEANCDVNYEFIIIDLEKECRAATSLINDISCCDEECIISHVEVFEFECNEDRTYNLTLNFNHEGTTNEFFDVWTGSNYLGFYKYEDLPVRITNFIPRNVEHDIIKICDNDNPDCCVVYEFVGPDCEDEFECTLENLTVLETACLDNGNIIVVVDFDLSDHQSNALDIWANGRFQYFERNTNTPLEIVLEGIDKQDSILLKLCINDHPDCCVEVAFEVEQERECELFDITVLQTYCEDDFYYLVVDAEHGFSNLNQQFVLRGNGRFYGEYTISNLPVALGPFNIDENINELGMQISGIEGCNASQELEITCECISSIVEIDSEEFLITDGGNEIIIESITNQNFQLELYTLDGKILMTAQAYGNYTVNKNNLSGGIYVLKINSNGSFKSFKIFISE